MGTIEQNDGSGHQPVLYQQVMKTLQPASPGKYIDGTVGAGGHAKGILLASSPSGRLLGLDLDPAALTIAKETLAVFGERVTLIQASYGKMAANARGLGWEHVDGILLDLGVSSMQLDRPEKGFSFQREGPLDMRFDPNAIVSAEEIVNRYSEQELAVFIREFGEERHAWRIARAILANRPIKSTTGLAQVIVKAVGHKPGKIHPATRTFQALRIAVNQELSVLEATLPEAIDLLASGGRLAVISFHSLEDRIVKTIFRRESRDCICPYDQPVCTCGHKAVIREINRKPITAESEEIGNNARARSARMRIAEKI